MGDLEGSTAIVTGAAAGIGAGIARVLAEHGAMVAATDLDLDRVGPMVEAIEAAGGKALPLAHDVTDEESCREVVRRAQERFGPLDLLVNNAGVSQRIEFLSLDEAAWNRMSDANLKGVYLMTRAAVAGMVERSSGSVINVASLVGKAGALPKSAHYVATKFGVVGLTQALASELAPNGIRVNAVCPGVVRTPLWGPLLSKVAEDEGITTEEAWEQAVATIPLGRPQEPEDIGETVAFLASDRARNITGEAVNVNGGQLMD